MNIAFLAYANQITGLGHWYRSITLAKHLKVSGNNVIVIGDRKPDGFKYHSAGYPFVLNNYGVFFRLLQEREIEWLIVDTPDEMPRRFYTTCRMHNIKICVLNGVGHVVGDRADLRIVQGFDDKAKYSGMDYVILRQNVFDLKAQRQEQRDFGIEPIIEWFVFGGASDKMELLRKFPNWPRFLFSVSEKEWNQSSNYDDAFLRVAAVCKWACVGMGMTVWELCAMRVKNWVVSPTPEHLKFALEMDRRGLIMAWQDVGIPDPFSMRQFLQTPFEITGATPDGRACERIERLLNG